MLHVDCTCSCAQAVILQIIFGYIMNCHHCYFTTFSETAGEEGREEFLREIELMKQIGSHRNIVSMLGYWVKSEPIMLILEYVPYGDLLQWLRNKRQQVKCLCLLLTLLCGSKSHVTHTVRRKDTTTHAS